MLTCDPDHVGRTAFLINPWTRVPDELGADPAQPVPSDEGFPLQDPTGFTGELSPDGSYRVTASADELIAAGASRAYASQNLRTGH